MEVDHSTMTLEASRFSRPHPHRSTARPVHPRLQLSVRRTGIVLRPNNSRVVIRPFEPASEHRIERILGRVASLSEAEVDLLLEDVMQEFRDRHQKTRQFFLRRFEQIRSHLLTDQPLSENRKLLMGAYFTQEYALESAALFNPSMVWHPDQSGLPAGSRRFILSLRATGEGHISSITFRSGVVDAQNQIHIDEPTRFVTAPELVAQHPLRQDALLAQAGRAGHRQPVRRPGPGDARRPSSPREEMERRDPAGRSTRAGRGTASSSRSPRTCSPWSGPTTRSSSAPS